MRAGERRTGWAGEHFRLSQPLSTKTLSISSSAAWTWSPPTPSHPQLAGQAILSLFLLPSPSPTRPPTAPQSLFRTSHPHLQSAVSPSLAQPGEAGREEFPGRKGLSHSAPHLVSDLDTPLEGVGRKRLRPHKFSRPVLTQPAGRGSWERRVRASRTTRICWAASPTLARGPLLL